MGVVYKAYDRLMNREVALKTILDIDNPEVLALFYKEWSTLVTMVHPNVINIYDIGEFEQEGVKKPFFVMPLLPGVTLDQLIKAGSPRLSVAGVVAIVEQAARGLHAAHEQGLVHRDVKPSNIFVMDDGSVKIIDFGIVRATSALSKTTLKGTLYYMAPEQLSMKPPTPLSDLFALGVVTYEALTRRRPFQGSSEPEIVEAIQRSSPPPISELNHEVPYAISQVVHKAIAKQPWHRFFNIREFGDSLTKALRNEPLDYFDDAKIKPRLERARQNYENGDYEFASEILSELEAEGQLDQNIALLRGQVDQAVRQIRTKQMLENARRFFDAAEYPLALRKVQEALELDPQDATALSLKSTIEKERREKKISEWITLARQHMENQAFRQAREALENVLQIKQNDTEALQLAAEIGRREQEVARVRDEKAKLYQAAMQAWEKGEMSSALSKLEVLIALDRDLPESDTARSNTYQSFYNSVHSEHNAVRNAYDEARRFLAADNLEGALGICRQYLAKYPTHALFQALKFDVEERQRQSLSAVIAETDRRVESEPDLDRRLAILDEVLKTYPGEPHFVRAAQTVRDKRDLVHSIVSKARFFEEHNQYTESLDQWQILKSIHEKQPGLAFEIERLIKRRDQQARQNSKARWVDQTDKYIENGDYSRAMTTIQNALTEFPGEAELLELDKLVRKNQERGKQAVDLLDRARVQAEKGPVEDVLDLLRQAHELDPRNTVIRTVLTNTLLDQVRRNIDGNPDVADAAVQELLRVDPEHVPARSLASQIADRKREDFVTWCMAQARRLQTDGDMDGALAAVAQGLAACPNDRRLQQLKTTLERARDSQRQSRMVRPAPVASEPSLAETVLLMPKPEAGDAAKPATEKPETPALNQAPPASAAKETPAPPASEPASGSTPPAVERAPIPPTEILPPSIALSELLVPPSEIQPAEARPAPAAEAPTVVSAKPPSAAAPSAKPPSAQPIDERRGRKPLVYGIAAAAAVLILAIVGIRSQGSKNSIVPVLPSSGSSAASTGATIKVHVIAQPQGAEISVNGAKCGVSECSLDLKPGDYRAEASLADYRPASAAFKVEDGQTTAPNVSLTLVPLPPLVTLATDLTAGSVTLDRAEVKQVPGSTIDIPKLSAGSHTIAVEGGAFRAAFTINVAEDGTPSLAGPIQSQGIFGFVLTHVGNGAKVYGSLPGVDVTLDGMSVGTIGTAPLELKDLAPGAHELKLDGKGAHARLSFDGGPAPAVVASLVTNRNLGAVTITSSEDGATVFLNGDKFSQPTKNGRLLLYLPPKSYAIRVQKDGFASPPDQTVDLRNGEESQIQFKLLPAKATLAVHRGMAGAEVLLDGNRVGVVTPDGNFTLASVEPGKHSISLRRDRYKTVESSGTFVAGKSLELEGAMQSVFGTLKIETSPPVPDLHVRIRRQGESQDREVKDPSVPLAEGNYIVTASAPKYQDATTTVHVNADGTTVAVLAMKAVPAPTPAKSVVAPPPAPATAFLLSDWLKTGEWTRDGQMLKRQGGNFVLAPMNLAATSIRFSAKVLKGKRLEWVAGYRDPRNYYLFQWDDTNFNRTEVVDGKHSKTVKIPLQTPRDAFTTFSIEITPRGITHSVSRDQHDVELETWNPATGFPAGQFGFLVQGRDEIGLAEFRLTQK